jgi:hypothetical protein
MNIRVHILFSYIDLLDCEPIVFKGEVESWNYSTAGDEREDNFFCWCGMI